MTANPGERGPFSVPRRLTNWARRQPAPVWAMAMIYGVGGAMCLFAAAFPLSPTAPVTLATILGCIGLVSSAALLRFGAALSPVGLQVAAVAGTLASSVLVAACSVLASESLARLNTRLRTQLVTDPLTGLLNRSGFADAAQRVRALAERGNLPVSLALIDLDEFKQVNDRQGHAAGDRLLVDLGRAWRAELRGSEVLGRCGGDEFVLLLAGAGRDGAEDALRRLHAASPACWSVGVAEWRGGESLDRAMVRADEELYRAKRGARELRDTARLTSCEPLLRRSSSALHSA